MDYAHMTAPCGLDCFNCTFYHADQGDADALKTLEQMSVQYNVPKEIMPCKGCRNLDGKLPLQLHVFGEDHYCASYECAKEKGLAFCSDCDEFPCDHLHPYADMATEVPHNTKVFNLCLIKKMGLETWAKEKAGKVKDTYFNGAWKLK